MNRVIHFEIHASDPEKSAEFYKSVFGWEIRKWDSPTMEYWVIMTGPDIKEGEVAGKPGINGGIVKRMGASPAAGAAVSAFVCTIGVSSVDEYLKKIEAAGGKIALPKMAIPGLAWLAYGIDIDGNIFGIFENDKNAK